MATAIGTLGAVDTFSVGGRVFTDLPNLLEFGAGVNLSGAGQVYSALTLSGTTVSYQVPSGHTLYILAVTMMPIGTDANIAFASGTNDVGTSTSTVPTGLVPQFNNAQLALLSSNIGAGYTITQYGLFFPVAQNLYPYMLAVSPASNTQTSARIFGYLDKAG